MDTREHKMIEVRRFESIDDIEEVTWNSIVPGDSFFHRYRFVRSMEKARVQDSQFWYLLFYRGNRLAGSAVLTTFSIALELFTGGFTKSWIKSMRRFYPDFFKVKILFCGLPISIGRHNLFVADSHDGYEIMNLLYREMLSISKERNISYLCLKEFDDRFVELNDFFLKHNFFCLQSIPYVSMDIRWSRFADYLKDLRHAYRRQIKKTLEKRGWIEPCIEMSNSLPEDDEEHLILSRCKAVCNAEKFFDLYNEVMEHAGIKLETLNQKFFEEIFENMHDEFELLSFVQGKEVLGSAILHTHDKSLTFLLIGLNYRTLRAYDVYFNMTYALVKLAIDRRCSVLNLGQTSYYLKQRIGGTCNNLYFLLKSKNPLIQLTFKLFKKYFFPAPQVPSFRAFRLDADKMTHG